MSFFEGFVLGFGMIVFIGPVLMQLLTVSIQFGILPGVSLAFGIFLSDICCILICVLAKNSIQTSFPYITYLAVIGAFFLFFLGFRMFFTRLDFSEPKSNPAKKNLFSAFAKGFLVNFVNPFVFFVWLGVVVYVDNTFVDSIDKLYYYIGAVLAILFTDVSKVFLSKQIGQLLHNKRKIFLFRICGILLIGFGIRLLISTF